MKLYTEEQVKQMIEKSRETGFTADYLIATRNGIQLPSDEDIRTESFGIYDVNTIDEMLLFQAFNRGAKYIKDKIQQK